MDTVRRVKARKVQCPFCPKTFTRTEHLQRHLGSHGVGKAVTCPECGKEFMRKDVMKRHLSKCQFKFRGGNIDGIATAQGQQSLSNTQSTTTNTPQQETLRRANPPSAGLYNPTDELSDPPAIQSGPSATEAETNSQFLLPGTPPSETLWGDLNFEGIQFLFDPTFLDRDEDTRLQQEAPSGFGVPCINIDPADTFNFLARIASKETASLETRYDCSLYERQWAGQELLEDGRQDAVAVAGADAAVRHLNRHLALYGNLHSSPLVQSAHEIVQQIKNVSQESKITHAWTSQLEKDCTRFFSPRNIERFVRIYWTAWHPHYPVIHKPTFSIADAPTYLTAAMCIMGACFSPNENDRIHAKLWLNSVEEVVFTNPYFSDIILHDEATVNVRDIVQLLQAAYCVSTFQISEGSKVSQRRIRRQRFNMLVSLTRDLNLFNTAHRNLDQLHESDFCWDSFIAGEECIRTMLFTYIHDTGFAIFSNYPPRTRIQEMSLDMACPEACFQAPTARDCFASIKTWTSHSLWKCRMPLREIVELILCSDINHEVQAYLSHLGILNLWIVCSALVSETLQINTLLTATTLTPMRRAIHNWKASWNQRYMIPDNFGLPKEEDTILARPEDSWRRVGFFQNASEYWLLVHILIERVGEQQRDRCERIQSGFGDGSCRKGVVRPRPYTPSRCDEPAMVDLKGLILEHHRRFGGR
ncbi:hypothetical protein BDW62DRAFT_216253 [Aspergillus aurantiobrunneus]